MLKNSEKGLNITFGADFSILDSQGSWFKKQWFSVDTELGPRARQRPDNKSAFESQVPEASYSWKNLFRELTSMPLLAKL